MLKLSIGSQNITVYKNKDNEDINLISEYGRIDVDTLKTDSDKFVLPTGSAKDSRANQINGQMWRCLKNTLTPAARASINAFRTDYEQTIGRITYTSAPLLLKTMMRLTTLDNRATNETL